METLFMVAAVVLALAAIWVSGRGRLGEAVAAALVTLAVLLMACSPLVREADASDAGSQVSRVGGL